MISIHALCEEGDCLYIRISKHIRLFLSTPSARRATRRTRRHQQQKGDFYPRPLRGGRRLRRLVRRTRPHISIHALCEEGDVRKVRAKSIDNIFLSTPSARRATGQRKAQGVTKVFLSTPSARRATIDQQAEIDSYLISIHALCEEGDIGHFGLVYLVKNFYPRPLRGGRLMMLCSSVSAILFLSTPSARRATSEPLLPDHGVGSISIHALCEEGDHLPAGRESLRGDFYPRPLRGGRRLDLIPNKPFDEFLSTPSARRATRSACQGRQVRRISIHALCEEGDSATPSRSSTSEHFYPRPLRGGRPARHYPTSGPANFYPRPLRGGRQTLCIGRLAP